MTRSIPPVPSRQTVIATHSDGGLMVMPDVHVPDIEPQSVLVRVRSVALNPCDFKMPALVQQSGLTAGSDFSGVIVALGSRANDEKRPGCPPWSLGDQVCGAVYGSNALRPRDGCFASYIEADTAVLTRIPTDWSWEQGAALGGSCVAAVGYALYHEMGLTWPQESDSRTPKTAVTGPIQTLEQLKKTVLVYGGSTACGSIAIQLLARAGYIVITTCSPRNNELVYRNGASAAFDYRSPSCAADIKAYTASSLGLILDCIANEQSTELCYAAAGRAGGQYVGLEKYPTHAAKRKVVRGSWVFGPVMFGRPIDTPAYQMDADPGAREFALAYFAVIEKLAGNGAICSHPARVLNRGGPEDSWTDAIINGVRRLRDGEVSGHKLVVHINQ